MNGLIFDLDGTLLNTIGDLHASTNYALKKLGFPERSLQEVQSFVGDGLKMLIKRALPQNASDELINSTLAEMKAHYANHCHDLTNPYEGITEMLRACKEMKIPMAVVSNKADHLVKLLCEYFFSDFIHIAIGESDARPRKPAPDMVHFAMKELGVSKAIYVGDSEVDILTAKHAALPCLSVTWGFRTEKQLRNAGATELLHSPSELITLIENDR